MIYTQYTETRQNLKKSQSVARVVLLGCKTHLLASQPYGASLKVGLANQSQPLITSPPTKSGGGEGKQKKSGGEERRERVIDVDEETWNMRKLCFICYHVFEPPSI